MEDVPVICHHWLDHSASVAKGNFAHWLRSASFLFILCVVFRGHAIWKMNRLTRPLWGRNCSPICSHSMFECLWWCCDCGCVNLNSSDGSEAWWCTSLVCLCRWTGIHIERCRRWFCTTHWVVQHASYCFLILFVFLFLRTLSSVSLKTRLKEWFECLHGSQELDFPEVYLIWSRGARHPL